ncbi:MAG: type II toxin-antitoxin system VapC family toxin [Bryobacteraceae bacterium]
MTDGCHTERGSRAVTSIVAERRNRIFTSRLVLIELTSVAAIKVRTGAMTVNDASEFLDDVADSARSQRFIVQRLLEEDYVCAQRLLTRHAQHHRLRTLDSLHLASALRRRDRSGIDCFVTSDHNLAAVAALEKFDILIPEDE